MTATAFRRHLLPIALLPVLLTGCLGPSPDALVAKAEQAYQGGDYRAAVIDLKAALQEAPEHARGRWILAQVYLAVEDGASAEKELERARSLGTGEDAILPDLAQALFLQRRYDEVLALVPEGPLSAVAKGNLLAVRALARLGLGEPDQAATDLDKAGALAPRAANVLYARAQLEFKRRDLGASQQAVDELIAAFPKDPRGWSLRGDVLGAQRDFAGAEAAYSQAMTFRANSLEDRMKRGFARVAQQNWPEADEDAAALRAAAPNFALGHYLGGLVKLQAGELEQAQEALEQAYDLASDHFQTLFLLAAVDMQLGNDNRSRQLAERVVARVPGFVPGRKLAATWYLRDRKPVDAERMVRPIVQARPDDVQAKSLLASSLIAQEERDEAAAILQAIAEQQTDSAQAQLRAGAGLMSAGDSAAGIAALGRAVEMAPDDPGTNAALVTGYLQTQSAGEAVAAARAFVERRPDDPHALNLLAAAQLAAGSRAEGLATYERVLGMDAGNLQASRALATLALAEPDPVKAAEYVKAGLAAHPADLRLLLIEAAAARAQGDRAADMAALQRAIDAHPEAPGPRALMARQLLEDNAPDRALLVLDGANAEGHSGMLAARAEAYHRLNRLDESKRDLEALARLMPESAGLQVQLARTCEDLGDRACLERALSRIIELVPNDGRGFVAKARVAIGNRSYEEARRLLDQPPVVDLDAKFVLPTRIALARAEKDSVAEVRYASELFDLQPSAVHAVLVSRAQQRAGAYSDAEAVLKSWLDGHPDAVPVAVELANFYVGRGNIASSVEVLRRIEAISPENLYALNNLAWYLRDTSPAEALGFAERAYELASNQPNVIDTYAAVLAENRDFTTALRMIDKAIELSRQPLAFRLHKAEILNASGNAEAAVAELSNILGQRPSEEIRNRAEALLNRIQG